MVQSCAGIATEELWTQNMSYSAKGTHDKPGGWSSKMPGWIAKFCRPV
jgi:hypothetical protein